MVYKRQLDFKHSYPSGCDTSKLLSDDLKNKLYYDCFQKMLYHYSHQEKPVHVVYWFFFLSARWKGLEQGGGAQRRKQSAQCNNDDRSLRLKQGGVVGAAF